MLERVPKITIIQEIGQNKPLRSYEPFKTKQKYKTMKDSFGRIYLKYKNTKRVKKTYKTNTITYYRSKMSKKFLIYNSKLTISKFGGSQAIQIFFIPEGEKKNLVKTINIGSLQYQNLLNKLDVNINNVEDLPRAINGKSFIAEYYQRSDKNWKDIKI